MKTTYLLPLRRNIRDAREKSKVVRMALRLCGMDRAADELSEVESLLCAAEDNTYGSADKRGRKS